MLDDVENDTRVGSLRENRDDERIEVTLFWLDRRGTVEGDDDVEDMAAAETMLFRDVRDDEDDVDEWLAKVRREGPDIVAGTM